MKKKICILFICFITALVVDSNNFTAYASAPTSMEEYQMNKNLGAMEYSEFNSVSKPISDENILVYNANEKHIKNILNVPIDGGIYQLSYNSKSGEKISIGYKYLYFDQAPVYNYVRYYYFCWKFVNGVLSDGRITYKDKFEPELYSKLISEDGFQIASDPDKIPRSISDLELNKLRSYTLEQLKAISKPMPNISTRIEIDQFGTSYNLKSSDLLPEDNNIYYLDTTWKDGTHFQTFYKFLYVKSAELNTITYHIYMWGFINGIKDNESGGDGYGNIGNEELYKEITPKEYYDPEYRKQLGLALDDKGKFIKISGKSYTQKRIGGATRIDTAEAIAEEFNGDKIDNIVVASGFGFADALSGCVLAKKLNTPILLLGSTLTDSVAPIEYIQKNLNKNGTIYILGGKYSVNDTLETYFKTLGYNVRRLSGNSRYDTNEAINNQIDAPKGTPIIVANGEGFADALSISSIASSKGMPIILSRKDTLSTQAEETIKRVQPSQIYIIGGIGSISDDIKEQIKSLTSLSDDKIIRIWGNTRYETSLNIAKYFNLKSDTVIIANGEGFADALAGSVLAAKYNSPIILVSGDVLNQKQYIDSTKYTNEIILGGNGSINRDIIDELSK